MKSPENIQALSELPIDMIGLIFYEKSPRCVEIQDADKINALSIKIPKVGVFVNATKGAILEKVERFGLQYVQLHGGESPEFCGEIKKEGISVIKSFQLEEVKDFEICYKYENKCDYFLFDSATPQYGGSGKKFNWDILNEYSGQTPFILSGGIGPEDSIPALHNLFAIDLNSKFETSPGIKDIESLRRFIFSLRA